jgi:membrane-anchored glycerophosphoryl diester phosphodiesterase (GDPDase)
LQENLNPFSLYDFLGYLIPGAIAVGGFFLIFIVCRDMDESAFSGFASVEYVVSDMNPVIWSTFIFFVFYLVGHSVGLLSSKLVEPLMRKICKFDFPLERLMGIKDPTRANFSYGKILIIGIFGFPVIIVYFLARNILGLYEDSVYSLNDNDRRIIFDAFHFKEQENLDSRVFLRRLYHRQIRTSDTTFLRTQNYIALYGFCRSISLIFLIFSWIFFFFCFSVDCCDHKNFNIVLELGICGLISSIVSAIFGYGFLKFQRRFAEELVFSALNDLAPVRK